MKKYIYSFLLIGIFGLSACSEEGKQEAAGDLGKKEEVKKAEQVQGTVDNKAAADKKTAETPDKPEGAGHQ